MKLVIDSLALCSNFKTHIILQNLLASKNIHRILDLSGFLDSITSSITSIHFLFADMSNHHENLCSSSSSGYLMMIHFLYSLEEVDSFHLNGKLEAIPYSSTSLSSAYIFRLQQMFSNYFLLCLKKCNSNFVIGPSNNSGVNRYPFNCYLCIS